MISAVPKSLRLLNWYKNRYKELKKENRKLKRCFAPPSGNEYVYLREALDGLNRNDVQSAARYLDLFISCDYQRKIERRSKPKIIKINLKTNDQLVVNSTLDTGIKDEQNETAQK